MTYRIGIAGAGMGGLAAASLLSKQGHEVEVLDQFDTPRPLGSGLVVQPVGQVALDACGALDAALAHGAQLSRMLGHEADSKRTVLDVEYGKSKAGRFGLAIHRSALFQALMDAALRNGAQLVTGAKVTGASNRFLLTEGSSHGPYDLVIDASGVNSPLSPMKTKSLPYGAIWGTVDWPDTDLPLTELRQRYRKASHMVGVLPIGTMPNENTRKAAIFWSLPSDGYAGWLDKGLDHWRKEAAALWPDFAPFAKQITSPEQMTMARYAHGSLGYPVTNDVIHIGDSAHRASPQLGQGANMALLDALAVAAAVDQVALPEVARAYVMARRWHVRIYQWFSAAFTPQYQSDSHFLPFLRDRVLFPMSQTPPLPRVLSSLACGALLPPLASLEYRH